MDVISGVALLKKQRVIQKERCSAVKVKLHEGCKDKA